MVLCGFILINLFIKWHPWTVRYQLPFFVLMAPVIGVVSSRSTGRIFWNIALIVLMLGATPYLFINETRPLLSGKGTIFNTPRVDQYFACNPKFSNSYKQVTDRLSLSQCSNIGLRVEVNTWEYPIWALLRNQLDQPIRMEAIEVSNPTAKAQLKKKELGRVFISYWFGDSVSWHLVT